MSQLQKKKKEKLTETLAEKCEKKSPRGNPGKQSNSRYVRGNQSSVPASATHL
jgi:hypothetical protein